MQSMQTKQWAAAVKERKHVVSVKKNGAERERNCSSTHSHTQKHSHSGNNDDDDRLMIGLMVSFLLLVVLVIQDAADDGRAATAVAAAASQSLVPPFRESGIMMCLTILPLASQLESLSGKSSASALSHMHDMENGRRSESETVRESCASSTRGRETGSETRRRSFCHSALRFLITNDAGTRIFSLSLNQKQTRLH